MAASVSAFLRRRCRMSRGSLGMIQSFARSLNSQTKAAAAVLDNPALNYVIVQGSGNSRTAVLNRPSTLNALNTSMCFWLCLYVQYGYYDSGGEYANAYDSQKLYESWENDPDVGLVALKGSGRAFCAGGDIVGLWQLINKAFTGDREACKDFFWTLYSFIYLLGTYLKPHVALLNGITMGGGAGVSIPGTFRVATDKTVFATPETLIGFHPDAGASFHLSHLSGCLGEYLALTGDKLNGAEMSACGLATHYSLHAKLPLIEEQIGNLVTDDPSVIEASLEKYRDFVCPDNMSIIQRTETIDRCFGHETVEEIIDSLGVRARMVNKDFAPKWDPPSLEQVSKDMVDQYFSPLNENLGPELELPTTQREAFR
ncbi:hypothetical protein AgCh_000176 [Apium graveolens]